MTLKKASSFSSSTFEWAKSGFQISPQESFNNKMEICRSCESFDKDGFSKSGKCNECGCSLVIKLMMKSSKCPLKKW